MASELRVDKIIPTTGVPTGGGGGIIQIVQSSTNNRVGTSSGTYVASNLSVSITPKFSTSKILVNLAGEANTNGSGHNMCLTLYRQIASGSYVNIAPQGGNDGSAIDGNYGFLNTRGDSSRIRVPVTINYLDSPGTTSQLTYKIYLRAVAGSGTVEFPVNNGYNHSFITAYEVSA